MHFPSPSLWPRPPATHPATLPRAVAHVINLFKRTILEALPEGLPPTHTRFRQPCCSSIRGDTLATPGSQRLLPRLSIPASKQSHKVYFPTGDGTKEEAASGHSCPPTAGPAAGPPVSNPLPPRRPLHTHLNHARTPRHTPVKPLHETFHASSHHVLLEPQRTHAYRMSAAVNVCTSTRSVRQCSATTFIADQTGRQAGTGTAAPSGGTQRADAHSH